MVLDVFLPLVGQFCLATVATAIIGFAVWYWKVVKPREKMLSKIPVTFPGVPLLGSSYYFSNGGPEFREQLHQFCYRDNGPAGICCVWVGLHPVVVIWKAKYIEALLSSHEIKKSYFYTFVKPWLGEGLLTSHGEHWYSHRKLLTPSFHFRILNDFIPVMNEHADHLVQSLEKHVDSKEVDIFPFVTMATLNTICEAAMGQTTGEEDRKAREKVFQAVIGLSHTIQHRQKNVYLWPDPVFALTPTGRLQKGLLKTIHDYTDKIFKERCAVFDRKAAETLMTSDEAGASGKRRPLPFLDSLLYSSQDFTKLSERDIIDEVNTFLFTGHDTTAASTAWTLYLLARHPEVQKKVHEELDTIFGSSNRPVTNDDVKEMRYLSACLKESLRLYPVAPIYARELMDVLQMGEYQVPPGTTVMVLNEILHRDPDYFEEPLKFKPERFLTTSGDADADDANSKIHPFAYVPFSAGQRNCIGQRYAQIEDKIMVASVMRRFTLVSDYDEEDLAPAVEVILRPTKGMYVQVHYRQ